MVTSKTATEVPTKVWSSRHPLAAAFLLIVIILAGLFGFSRLPAGLPPHLSYPYLLVLVHDPGVPATIMDERVAAPLLHDFSALPGPRDVRSTSSEGDTNFALYFDSVPQRERTLPQLQALLARDATLLPSTADRPVVVKGEAFGAPRVELMLTAPGRSLVDLRHWTEENLLPQFVGLHGVASVRVDGGPLREIQVVPDQRRLAGLGLALDDVVSAVRAGEAQSPQGYIVAAARAGSAVIGTLPVRLASGDTLSLSEVSRVRETEDDVGPVLRFDGKPAVRLLLTESADANPIEVDETIRARLDWLHANGLIAKDVQVTLLAPQVHSLVHLLRRFYLLISAGLLLVCATGLLFGGSWRVSLFQLVAVLAALSPLGIPLLAANMTLNVFSLTGIVLVAGLALAAPIAAQESASAFAPDSKRAAQAAARAALSTVLPLVFVLLLLLVVPEVIGLVGFDLAAVTVFALLLSAILVLTLLRGWLLHVSVSIARARRRRRLDAQSPWVHYRAWLSAAIKRPLFPAAIAGLCIGTAIFYGRSLVLRTEFLPLPATSAIRVQVAAFGKTPGVRLGDAVPIIENLARAQGNVTRILSVQNAPPAASAQLHIELDRQMQGATRTREWIARFEQAVEQARLQDIRVRAVLSAFPGASPEYGEGPLLRAADSQIGVRVSGRDRKELTEIGGSIADTLRGVAGVRDVHFAADTITRDFVLQMDPALAAEQGVDEAQAARAVRIARGGLVAGSVLDGDDRLDVRVVLPRVKGEGAVPARLLLRGETRVRPAVYLNQVASVSSVREADDLSRDNDLPVVAVNGVLATGTPAGKIVTDIEQRVNRLPLPQGYRLSFTGVVAGIIRENRAIMRLALLGLPLFVLLLVLRYRGWRRPTVVLLSMPFTLVGAIAALALWRHAWSLPAWMGAILALGVGSGMAMLMLDLIDQRLPSGSRAAALAGVATKAAPGILRFGSAVIAGPLLLALFAAPDLALLRPLAMTLSAGVLAAVVAALLWTPVLYSVLLIERNAAPSAHRAPAPGRRRRAARGGNKPS